MMDKETSKKVLEGEVFSEMVNSDAWKHARSNMFRKCFDLDRISNIPNIESIPDDQLGREVKNRYSVMQVWLSWLSDIEGSVNQTNAYLQDSYGFFEEEFVVRRNDDKESSTTS